MTESADYLALLWDCDLPAVDRRGLYVAISGNTAAGKSSLITKLEQRLRESNVDAIGISERIFHHRYLRLMFSSTRDFAFPIQLSFMLERHMVLLRNLVQLGRVVVMERSHLDDPLFVEEHVGTGAIDAEQAAAYAALSGVLAQRIPAPDVLVLMNPAPDLSVQRLAVAERRGDRPSEFPTEQAKIDWVRRWHEAYVALHARYRSENRPGGSLEQTTLVVADPMATPEENLIPIMAALEPRLKEQRCLTAS